MSTVAVRSTEARRSFRPIPTGATTSSFYEYFHGDNGAGLGASHQTGWTGLVAKFIELFGRIDATQSLAVGKTRVFSKQELTEASRTA